MYTHHDADERCYSDSLAELPEHDIVKAEGDASAPQRRVRALSLDVIKQRLDKGLYKRLDLFQKDVFSVLERARTISRSDSQIFEDAVELQLQFIKLRDEVCGNGETLQSQALLFTSADLQRSIAAVRAEKKATEQPEEDTETDEDVNVDSKQENETSSTVFNQQQYTVGEFVYCSPAGAASVAAPAPASAADKKDSKPLIYLIENIYTNAGGEQMMRGNQFVRPEETFHVPTRKFLEKEVFRTEMHESLALGRIVGRCCVVPVREYMRTKPEGFEDKDVYVCESR